MNYFKIKLIFLIFSIVSTTAFAGDQSLKYVPGFKSGDGIATIINDIEYERNLIPFTTGYIRIGGSNFDIPRTGVNDVNVDLSNFSLGFRYNFILFYLGVGYDSSTIKLKDGSLSAKGTITGPSIEIGKSFGLGPVNVGASLGLNFAKVDVEFKSAIFDIGKLKDDGDSTLAKAEVFIGYSF